MELIGILKEVYDTQVVSERFKKRDFVVTTEHTTQYPQHVLLQLSQVRVDLLNGIPKGVLVKVAINLKGREWQSKEGEVKYFNTIEAWKIERFTEQK